MISLLVLGLLGWWLVSSAVRLASNYRAARRSGFPVVVCPVNPQNLLYVLVDAPLRPLLVRYCPALLDNRFKVCTFGWQMTDRHAFHDAVGPVFVLVTTGVNQVWCADPAMAQLVLARRRDFGTVEVTRRVMSAAGQNTITSDGDAWARQRRLIAPQLNERISSLVWAESLAQGAQMAAYVSQSPSKDETAGALRSIAMRVLGLVAYGQPPDPVFRPLELPRTPTARMVYTDVVALMTELIVFAAFVPAWVLELRIMPTALQTLGAGLRQLPSLTQEMLDRERKKTRHETDETRDTLMGMMVRLSDRQRAEGGKKGEISEKSEKKEKAGFLSEDEIRGNLFLFTGAGFDTTANSMAYAAVVLATRPDVQAWARAEVDDVLGGLSVADAAAPTAYYDLYPRLVRCQALMFEVLRLYPPIMHVSREARGTHTLTFGGATHVLDGHFEVYVNSTALGTRPALWGDDSDAFRPGRWLRVGPDGRESIRTPPKGHYTPWSLGPRVCPGMKMAQVEFVTVFAALLRQATVAPVVLPGETMADACDRLSAVARDSQVRLTMQLSHPEQLLLDWQMRTEL